MPNSAEIGTATHFVMQSVDLEKEITAAYVTQLLLELVEDGLLEQAVAEKLDAEQIAKFFETELGQEIQANADRVRREMPFSLLIPASRIFTEIPEDSTDNLLIHGIIDGFIEYDDHIVLYDFKTDFVGDRAGIAREYRRQVPRPDEPVQKGTRNHPTETRQRGIHRVAFEPYECDHLIPCGMLLNDK